jgi:hypothetical protein
MHRYQNSERKKLTDSIRITSFVEYQWSKTNVKASFQHSAHVSPSTELLYVVLNSFQD